MHTASASSLYTRATCQATLEPHESTADLVTNAGLAPVVSDRGVMSGGSGVVSATMGTAAAEEATSSTGSSVSAVGAAGSAGSGVARAGRAIGGTRATASKHFDCCVCF